MILSIVSPVFEAKEILPSLVAKIELALNTFPGSYEIILVDDGSTDGGWSVIEKLCANHSKVKGLKLRKNFGQHNAILAGVSRAQGEFVLVMDCDLQDNPEDILLLYEKANEGFDVVFTKRKSQKHAFLKRVASSFFYMTIKLLFGNQHGHQFGSMLIFHRHLITQFLSLKTSAGNYVQNLLSLSSNFSSINVLHQDRFSGKSSYGLSKLIRLAFMSFYSTNNRLSVGRILVFSAILIFNFYFLCFMDFEAIKFGDQSFWLVVVNTLFLVVLLLVIYIGFLRYFFQRKSGISLEPAFEIEKTLILHHE